MPSSYPCNPTNPMCSDRARARRPAGQEPGFLARKWGAPEWLPTGLRGSGPIGGIIRAECLRRSAPLLCGRWQPLGLRPQDEPPSGLCAKGRGGLLLWTHFLTAHLVHHRPQIAKPTFGISRPATCTPAPRPRACVQAWPAVGVRGAPWMSASRKNGTTQVKGHHRRLLLCLPR